MTPIQIDPDAFYTDGEVRLALDVTDATITRARRRGELRFARKGVRLFYRGQWLLDWLDRQDSPQLAGLAANGGESKGVASVAR